MTLALVRRPTCEAKSAARKASPSTYTPPWKYMTIWRGSIPSTVISAVRTPPSAASATVTSAGSGCADNNSPSRRRCSSTSLSAGNAPCRRIASRFSRCSMLTDDLLWPRRPRPRSWVHRQAVAVVEPDRLHQPERDVRGKHIRSCQHAGVLLDDRGGRRLADCVEVALDAGPEVRAVLLEVGRRINAVEGAPRARLEIIHVLLMQDDVLARAEPAQMATDEGLPRVGQPGGGHPQVARDVVGQVDDVHGYPPRIDDVDHHQRVVLWKVNNAVVGSVVRAVPRELDPLATDLQGPALAEGFLRCRSGRVVVPEQEPPGLLVPDPHDVLAEERGCAPVVRVVVGVDQVGDLVAHVVGSRDLVDRSLEVVSDARGRVEEDDTVLRRQECGLIDAVGDPVQVPFVASGVLMVTPCPFSSRTRSSRLGPVDIELPLRERPATVSLDERVVVPQEGDRQPALPALSACSVEAISVWIIGPMVPRTAADRIPEFLSPRAPGGLCAYCR